MSEIIQVIYSWFSQFDNSTIVSEDDVETKFVIPMLKLFGYNDDIRRGKFPINDYKKGSGRKREIDQIYFSTNDTNSQNEETSLLLVEAKNINIKSLNDAIDQANFYANHIRPIIILVTDSKSLFISRKRNNNSNEIIFNSSIDDIDISIIENIYQNIEYSIVSGIKNIINNELEYKEIVNIYKKIQAIPLLKHEIDRNEFPVYQNKEGLNIEISRNTVKLECILPRTMKNGSIKLIFSNILLRNISIDLKNDFIIGNLLQGIDTSPYWNSRHFIRSLGDGYFEVSLGDVLIKLTEREAYDLCECIDIIGSIYIDTITKTYNLLNLWGYNIIRDYEFDSIKQFEEGFCIARIDTWLWNLLFDFAKDHDFYEPNCKLSECIDSSWNIFENHNKNFNVLVIRKDYFNNCYIFGVHNSDMTVDVLYMNIIDSYNDLYGLWDTQIGPNGIWSLTFTKDWLINSLIPNVLKHFPDRYEIEKDIPALIKRSVEIQEPYQEYIDIQFPTIDNVIIYLDVCIEWAGTCAANLYINVNYIKELYSFLNVFRKYIIKNSKEYIKGKILSINYLSDNDLNNETPDNHDYIIENGFIDNISRVNINETEKVFNLEMILRIFHQIINNMSTEYNQSDLNGFFIELKKLWEIARFEIEIIRRYKD